MITYQGTEVCIIGGDHRLREATIAWPDGRVRLVGLHQLKGTHGAMEVTVAWNAACKASAQWEVERKSAK